MNFLSDIIGRKRLEVQAAKRKVSPAALNRLVRNIHPNNSFLDSITRTDGRSLKVVAEFKRASPSKGPIADGAAVSDVARDYEKGGAAAISVLTEESSFKGSLSDLRQVREAVPRMPLLRKDFIVDEYQIYESLHAGADAVLFIVAALDQATLLKFISIAKGLGICGLVEVHSGEELEIALSVGAEVVGVNNRNLINFEVSFGVSESLAPKIPNGTVSICESGIKDITGLESALKLGYRAVLIGEHFMRSKDRVAEVRKFANKF